MLTYGTVEDSTNLKSLDEILKKSDVIRTSDLFSESLEIQVSSHMLYVREGEYATVKKPTNIKYIGSGDATTCHILIVSDRHFIGVIHLVHEDSVFDEMPKLLESFGNECDLYVVGGFSDAKELSLPISSTLVKFLSESDKTFSIKLWQTMELNTWHDETQPYPKCIGIAFNIEDNTIHKAQFSNRGPELSLRSLIVSLKGIYTSLYDTDKTYLVIPYAEFKPNKQYGSLVELRDDVILSHFSTSPHCEPPTFCDDIRRGFKFRAEKDSLNVYKVQGQPLYFYLDDDGNWAPVET